MLTGSTSALRSSQLPFRLLRHSTGFARGRPTAQAVLPRNRFSSIPQNALEEQNGPQSHDLFMTSRQRTPLSPAHPNVFANGTSFAFSGVPKPAADENGVHQVVGTQDHYQRPRARIRHKVVDRSERKCPALRRRTLLWVMLTAKSPDRSWAAYQELLLNRVVIPHHLLHQLARLLASIKPRTRTVYLQLLSVLKTLQRNRGRLRLWEWNTLIDCAGKQWHKTRLEDYENSFDIYNKRGVLPVGNVASAAESLDSAAGSYLTQQIPDIWTYNILLSIASRSTLPLAVRHASSLLLASGLPPDRYTHLCLLRYFAIRSDLRNVRSTLRKMNQQSLEVGLDGVNACLWAYARNRRFDVALRLYRILRSNLTPTPNFEDHDMADDSRYVHDTVGLENLDGIEPDEITYTMMIQALAYHGDLKNALSVFVDMLSTPIRAPDARRDGRTVNPVCYQPSMVAFRGLFLGFARHGRGPGHNTADSEPVTVLFPSSRATWDLDTLETIFTAFLRLPSLPKPTDRLVYWILVAFGKTSGDDTAKLQEVWTKLEAKYNGGWGGRLEEFRKSIFSDGDI